MSLPSSPPPEQQDLLLIYSSSSDDDLVTTTDLQIYGGAGDGERRRPFAVPPAPAVVFAPWFGIGGGPAPAPAASIDALPTVEVSEPGAVCPICKEAAAARRLPCTWSHRAVAGGAQLMPRLPLPPPIIQVVQPCCRAQQGPGGGAATAVVGARSTTPC